MKLIAYRENESTALGIVIDDSIAALDEIKTRTRLDVPSSMEEAIEWKEYRFDELKQLEKWAGENHSQLVMTPLESAAILPPIYPKRNIMCVGKNYAEHAVEMGSKADIPEYPIIFTKPPTAIIGTNDTIEADQQVTKELDYEGEIAVIIGKKGKKIPKEQALDYVFGFTLLNDVTARDTQARHKQFYLGKSMDTFCPLGPFVLLDKNWETFYPMLRTYVNGELRQESSMDKMIFSVQELISTLSAGMTLYPGDVIATGTPSGVGKGFKPPRFLQNGDEIMISADELGNLHNKVTIYS